MTTRPRPQSQPMSRRRFLGILGISGVGVAAAGLGVVAIGQDGASNGGLPAAGGATLPTTGATGTATGAGGGVVEISIEGAERVIRANGLPLHPLDADFRYLFGVSEQDYEWRVPVEPQPASSLTQVVTGQKFGVSIEGVPYDPATAEFWNGDPASGWLGDAQVMPLDVYGAHVQPGGVYHYHQYPAEWDVVAANDGTRHSVQVGWAADGFPIYAGYGYRDPERASSGITALRTSWRIRSGSRPVNSPGGTYDGSYVQDYEYVDGLGDLDQCNGRTCVTPEFPGGTYAYFLTTEWPYVPRWIRGTPSPSFARGPQGGASGGGGTTGGPAGGPPGAGGSIGAPGAAPRPV